MSRYLVLYHSEANLGDVTVADMFANTPPDQLEAGMAAWRAWHERCGSAIVDAGAPLSTSVTVTSTTAERGKTTISGYTVLEADSIDAAVALVTGHPHFYMPGATVQVLECIAIPGM